MNYSMPAIIRARAYQAIDIPQAGFVGLERSPLQWWGFVDGKFTQLEGSVNRAGSLPRRLAERVSSYDQNAEARRPGPTRRRKV